MLRRFVRRPLCVTSFASKASFSSSLSSSYSSSATTTTAAAATATTSTSTSTSESTSSTTPPSETTKEYVLGTRSVLDDNDWHVYSPLLEEHPSKFRAANMFGEFRNPDSKEAFADLLRLFSASDRKRARKPLFFYYYLGFCLSIPPIVWLFVTDWAYHKRWAMWKDVRQRTLIVCACSRSLTH